MLGLRALVDRFVAPAPAAAASTVVALLPFLRDWKISMEKIDEKISDAQDRRALLVAERDAAIIASVEGDTKATAKADQLDKQITTADRELERLTDPAQFDALFVIALAAAMAEHMCEQITQSNEKKNYAASKYKQAIADAKKTNAIENQPTIPPKDTWLTARR